MTMPKMTVRRAIGLALASAIVLGSVPIAAAHDRDDRDHKYHKYYKSGKYVHRRYDYYPYWNNVNRRNDDYRYWMYLNNRKYRTVTYVPSHCRKRIVSGRTFYYDDRAGYYYRYNPERRAYAVVNAVDLATFIRDTFF